MNAKTQLSLALLLFLVALALVAELYRVYTQRQDLQSQITYMVAKRVDVMEVENLINTRQPWRNEVERRGYAELIVDAATEFGKPPLVVARVALAESALKHRAIGDGGSSFGVMQVRRLWVGVIPFIHTERDLMSPAKNIRAGAWVLRYMADRCGSSVQDYLACYNGGEERAKFPNEQASDYARRVAG